MFVRLLNLSKATRACYSVASLKRVLHTGAMCPVEIKRRMIEIWGPILLEAYAATEGGGTVATCADWLKYPGTVGRPMPGTQLQILSDEGEELPTGAIGNIFLTRFSGDRFEYLGDPEKTKTCHRGEFFTLGDVGYVNEDGFLFLCDRKIDMINLGGMKVYSAEVENVLAQHPHVADCAVFGIPDEVAGEAIVALIQPAPGAPTERNCLSEISTFLGRHLSVVKHPRYVEFVAALPREDNGKLSKRRLRERYITDVRARKAEMGAAQALT
jgi:long-chain acyl-CoA synthetase